MTDTSSDVRDAIRTVIETYGQLRKTGDVDGIVDLFTAEGSVMPPGAPASVGAEQLNTAYAPFRTAIGMECRYEFDEILVDADLASARTRSSGTVLNRETGEQTPASWRELFVLRRVDERWKIAQYMFQSAGE
jgi:uncharacterized protein (TIGR02246 family)